ncbi:MAG: hypothetical protein ABR922_09610 [Streptosporangiaceae bacterium]
MRLLDYLDKGASLSAAAPCLTMQGNTLDYGAVQRLSYRIGPRACLTIVPPNNVVNTGPPTGSRAGLRT